MAKYKAGVFGIGNVSTEYIKAVNNNPLSEVIAVVGRDKTKTQAKIRVNKSFLRGDGKL